MSKIPHKVFKLKVPQPVYKTQIEKQIDPMMNTGSQKSHHQPTVDTPSIFLKDEDVNPKKKQLDVIVAHSTVKKSQIDLTRGNQTLIPTQLLKKKLLPKNVEQKVVLEEDKQFGSDVGLSPKQMEEPPLQKKAKLNELDAFFQEIKRLE